jgi:hypothetical protein
VLESSYHQQTDREVKIMFFFVEITDTFAGEANYSWVKRHKVKAKTQRGAVWKISRDSGISWGRAGLYGPDTRYNSASGCTCLFIEEWDAEKHGKLSRVSDTLAK